jgi:D-sedoheptulose 7-phosphate isomerase
MNNFSKDLQIFSSNYFQYLKKVLDGIKNDDIYNFISVLLEARSKGSKIYFIGNGGSAATASHFANDISIGTRLKKKPFRTISLCDNNAIITAIGNDYGYENIFSKQLEVLLEEDDVLVAISASGNSANLLKALDVAKRKKSITVGISSFDGGKLRRQADVSVHVPTQLGEYGPAEDAHMILDHLISNYLLKLLVDE